MDLDSADFACTKCCIYVVPLIYFTHPLSFCPFLPPSLPPSLPTSLHPSLPLSLPVDPPVVMALNAPVVGVGQQAILTCTVSSSVPPVVVWTGPVEVPDSAPTPSGGGFYVSTITIPTAGTVHRDLYTCGAFNTAGRATTTMEGTLYVVGECHMTDSIGRGGGGPGRASIQLGSLMTRKGL